MSECPVCEPGEYVCRAHRHEAPCAGVIVTDDDGNYLYRYGCEVHLFDEGTCDWQRKMNEERSERK